MTMATAPQKYQQNSPKAKHTLEQDGVPFTCSVCLFRLLELVPDG